MKNKTKPKEKSEAGLTPHTSGEVEIRDYPKPKESWEEIDELIRDITKAGFMPKSEARRRINALLSKQKRDLIERLKQEVDDDGIPYFATIINKLKDN